MQDSPALPLGLGFLWERLLRSAWRVGLKGRRLTNTEGPARVFSEDGEWKMPSSFVFFFFPGGCVLYSCSLRPYYPLLSPIHVSGAPIFAAAAQGTPEDHLALVTSEA